MSNFRIAITFIELKLLPAVVDDFINAYAAAGDTMEALEINLQFTHMTEIAMVSEFDGLPAEFETEREFYEAYLAKVKEIAAPMAYKLH